jgi:RND superfamily putative drug exporter
MTSFITRWRRWILAGAAVFTVLAFAFGGTVAGLLETGDSQFDDPASEAVQARETVERATGEEAQPGVVALVRSGSVEAVRERLADDPAVARAVAEGDTVLAFFRSGDDAPDPEAAVERLLDAFEDTGVLLGGTEVAGTQIGETVSSDLTRAELLALPIIFLLSFWIFRGVVAALLPPFVGVISVATTFLGLRLLVEGMDLSVFALNLVTALGLGLAIDYSLFIVSRFREELAAGKETREALARTLATAGRTVLFSALTVAAAMASLLVFPLQFLYSMGIGGIFVALASAAVALVVFPALLAVLGPRVNAGSPARWKQPPSSGRWARLAAWVMARPGTVALASAAVLVLLALPAFRATFVGVDASVLPASASARQVQEALDERGDAGSTSPLTVVLPDAPDGGAVEAVGSLDGVAAVTEPRQLAPDVWAFDVVSRADALTGSSKELLADVRGLFPAGQVTGETATFVDLQASLAGSLPWAVLVLALTTFVLLFLFTGSVVLPLKALLMNALTLGATLGAMVLLFEWGLGQGGLESTQPILLAAIAFGLSTDYAVFLLSRIKEARDRGLDDRAAVATGLEQTGRLITAAALLFCVAVGAFATSSITFIQQVGVGTAIAVLLDATIVRAFLVPSLMGLLGRWNWWAPRPLQRLHGRLGLVEEA